ncbi:hypothetical protein [Methylocapsa aurea]|uniref:hypothetical protein n=1 Tax=Methylocapsa aurea TaxID=663610 RepID=UPI00055F606B|nr:hypothetical protein [Methylocapsa aurea]
MDSPVDKPATSRSRRLLQRLKEPQWRLARIPVGATLTLGGLVGFLPLVGFWMLPLGLAILAVDIPVAGRLLRPLTRQTRRLSRYFRRRWRGPRTGT